MTIYTLSVTLITDLFYLILIQTISNKAKKTTTITAYICTRYEKVALRSPIDTGVSLIFIKYPILLIKFIHKMCNYK